MKRFLMILVFGLLFISIDLSNPTKVEAGLSPEQRERFFYLLKICRQTTDLNLERCWERASKQIEKEKGFFEKQWDKLPDLPNPGRYLEKRKECKEEADRADTVYEGKQRYKDCMDE